MATEAAMEANPLRRSSTVSGAISGFVLAGGASSRMGRSKAMLPWTRSTGEAGTMLTHAVDRLRQVCATVCICGLPGDAGIPNAGDLQPCGLDGMPIPDALPRAGPLAGIVAALEQSATEWNLFLAVDLPLVPVMFLHLLLARAATGQTAPVCVIPTLAHQPQPLCSLVRRSLASELRRALETGQYKLMLAFQAAAQQAAPGISEASAIDRWEIQDVKATTNLQPEEWFLNVNTPADWQLAQKLAAREAQRHL